MKSRKSNIIKIYTGFLVLVISGCLNAFGQQQPLYSQYTFEPTVINPAFAGKEDNLSVSFLTRQQWLGMEGAPRNYIVTGHQPFTDNTALGGLFYSDIIGPKSQVGFYGIYSYTIELEEGVLSMALQAGGVYHSSNFNSLNIYDETGATVEDPVFVGNDVSKFLPNFGTGFLYEYNNIFAGLSVPRLFNNNLDEKGGISESKERQHYFLYTGITTSLGEGVVIRPTLLYKKVKGTGAQYDINVSALLLERLWAGVTFRTSGTMSGMLDVYLSEKLSFGYAVDFGLSSKARSVETGTHELRLKFLFGKIGKDEHGRR
jgi:type IX secretion system PorP/SprF family membrane protein